MDNFFELSSLESFYARHNDSVVFAILASRYLEQNQLERAREVLEDGIRRHPHYGFGHYVQGLYFYQVSNFEMAQRHLELSTSYDDKNPRAWKLLGDIHERLELPAKAANSRLNYYLIDQFNPDAVERFYQEDTLQFDAFQHDDSTPPTTPPANEDTVQIDVSDESDIDEFFHEPQVSNDEIDISRRVEEVFKETLGDISVGTEFDLDEERENQRTEQTREFDFERVDLLDLDTPTEDSTETKADEAEKIKETLDSMFASTIDEDEDEEDDVFERPKPPDTNLRPAADDTLDKLENFTFDEPDVDIESPDNAFDDTDLDFSTFVDDFISERAESESTEPSESEPAPPLKLNIPDDAQLDVPVTPPQNVIRMDEAAPVNEDSSKVTDSATQFGRPPILSPTLGEIYIAQGRFGEAIEVFGQLLEKDPKNERFSKKIEDIRRMMDRQQS